MKANPMKWLQDKIRSIKTRIGGRWLTEAGFSVVVIIERDGTEYIVANDGSLLRIGGKTKVRK